MGEIQIENLKWEISEEEKEEEERAKIDIWKYIFGFVEMAVVKRAIELGIADAIANHGCPMTLVELSSALDCNSQALHRVLRFLVNRGIFKEVTINNDAVTCYAQTPISRLLMRTGKNSMAAFILFESSPPMLASWHNLSARVMGKGATSAFEAVNGEDIWKYAEANPAHAWLIDEAMACDARVAVPAIINGCSDVFDGISTLVDVGGGNGTSLRMVLKACPWIKGINFDLPHVVSVAEKCEGIEHVGGDMFEFVPKADAAFLMWVLHDWDDDECIRILKRCREAIPKDKGKLIIAEAVIENKQALQKEDDNDKKLKEVGLVLDMVMMAHTNKGKERTLEEWVYVLREAGLGRHAVRPIAAVQSVIEAFPA